jgi:hypothetical protein
VAPRDSLVRRLGVAERHSVLQRFTARRVVITSRVRSATRARGGSRWSEERSDYRRLMR